MPTILTTDPESGYPVEIAGVGILGRFAQGGIPAEHAARVVHELQDADGEPLTGSELNRAAQKFAKARGLATRTIAKLDEDAREELRVAGGAFPRGKSIEQISREASERDFGTLAAHTAPTTKGDLEEHAVDQLPAPSTPEVWGEPQDEFDHEVPAATDQTQED